MANAKRRVGRPKGSSTRVKREDRAVARATEGTSRNVDGMRAGSGGSGEESAVEIRQPWEKGGPSPNPGGRPRGYVSFAAAYSRVSTLEPGVIARIAEGKFPASWDGPRSAQYKLAACVYRKAMADAPSGLLDHVADRTDGKVVQQIRQSVDLSGVILLPQSRPAAGWASIIDVAAVDPEQLGGSSSSLPALTD